MKKLHLKSLKHHLISLKKRSLNILLTSPKMRSPKNRKRIALRIGLVTIAILLPLVAIYTYQALTAKGAWSGAHRAWAKRKNVTVTNNSTDSLAASTTVAVTVDTHSLYAQGKLQEDCDDLRVLYSTDGQSWTELDRYVSPAGGTTCATSTATKVYFPLQAALASTSSSSDYYIYYSNGSASSPSSTIDTFDTSSANALLVCPFDGDTDCVNSAGVEQPSTETGAIRYGGAKTAMSFDGESDYVTATSAPELDNLSEFTMEAWVFFEDNGSYRNVLEKNNIISLQNPSYRDNTIRAYHTTSDQTADSIAAIGSVSRNEWHHVAATYSDTGDRKFHLYIDGAELSYDIQQAATGTLNSNSGSWYIGQATSGENRMLGLIDELRISNIVRYTSSFSVPTAPFVRDPYTKLLLHFDEGGDDPRNTGKAIDDSGNGNHGTITGASYVTGLVGVDTETPSSSSWSNAIGSQSYAGHEGVFIEEGTTNLIKNPSFDHSTFNTLWSDEEDDSTVFNLATASATFTPNMAKRNAPGPFTTAPIIQGEINPPGSGSTTDDSLTFSRGSQISGEFYDNWDNSQGSISLWYTPEFSSGASTGFNLLAGWGTNTYVGLQDNDLLLRYNNTNLVVVSDVNLTAGTTYHIVARWDTKNTLDGTNYASLSINNNHSFDRTSSFTSQTPLSNIYVGNWNTGNYAANGIVEGLTVYRRPLYESTTPSGIDVGNGDEILKIYDSDESGDGSSPQDPTLVTGSWDVVFAMPTDSSTGTLGTTGEAWSHPHSSNLLSNGFFMDDPVFNDWELEGSPSATGSASTTDKVFAGGGYFTSDAADEGIYQDITVSAGDDFVIRAIAHSDDTCVPRVILYDQSNTAEIGHLDGATDDDRTDPATLIFTGEAPSGCTNLRVKLVNTASSGTCYWHQVEVLSNLLSNPSMEGTYAGTPLLPPDYSNDGLEDGDTAKETGTVHSGSASFKFQTDEGNEGFSQVEEPTDDKYYSIGAWGYESSGSLMHDLADYTLQSIYNTNNYTQSYSSASWALLQGVYKGFESGASGVIRFFAHTDPTTAFVDDAFIFQLDDVDLTVTAASEANSAEDWGLRVDGNDTLSQAISSWTTTAGTARWRWTPRHDAGDFSSYGVVNNTPRIARFMYNNNNYIEVNTGNDSQITLFGRADSTSFTGTWDATGSITAGTTYEMEVIYTADSAVLKIDDDEKVNIDLTSTPSFTNAPNTAYWGSTQAGTQQTDAVFSDPSSNPGSGNITDTEETSAPYFKFGSKSAKLVAGANDYYTVRGLVTSGTTYTLSAYVYDGTAGNIGGTVDNTVAQLVYEGANISGTTYTDMGGGWWRLTYSVSALQTGVEHFGVYALNGKTVYVDGVQLEEAFNYASVGVASTYCDGSLGTNYSWSSTAHESTSSRTGSYLRYDSSSNLSTNTGSVSFWIKREYLTSPGPMIFRWHETGSSNYYFIYCQDNSENCRFSKRIDGGYALGTSFQSVPVGQWTHIVATWDTTSGIAFYVNTSKETNSNTDVPENLESYFDIGYGDTAFTAGAIISNFQTFDDALTDAEVADFYYSGLVAHSESIEVERHDDVKGQAPLAVWHFDEGYGTTAYDSSMYGNDLTIVDATASGDLQSSNARAMHLEFDGTNSYLERVAESDFAFDDDSFSVSGWFRHPSTISSTQYIATQYSSGSDYGGWKVYMNSSGYVCFAIDDDATWGPDDEACSSTSYADSSWHHFQVVKDGTSNLYLYLDGEHAFTKSVTATGSLTNNNNLYVGVDSDGSSNSWQGFLDEIVIYPYARSADHAKTDATSGPHQTSAVFGAQEDFLSNGLVGYWKMDESSGTRYDSSGNGNDLSDNATVTSGVGKFGSAGQFTASNSEFLNITDNASLSTGTIDITITAWVYLDSTGERYIATKGGGGSEEFAFGVGNSNPARFCWNFTCVDNDTYGNFPTETWMFVIGYHDATKDEIGISVNGGAFDTASSTGGSDTANDFRIGRARWDGAYWDGRIEEVRYYKRLLTPSEVEGLYRWTPGPVGYWDFNENTGNTANDKSGNGNDGTLTHNATWDIGKYGSSLKVDGTVSTDGDTHVRLSDDIYDTHTQGTISAWVKLTDTGDDYQPIFFGGNSYDNDAVALYYKTFSDEFIVWVDESGGGEVLKASLSYSDIDNWHHVALTMDSNGNKFYIDGVQQTLSYDTGNSSTSYWFDDVASGATHYTVGGTPDSTDSNDCFEAEMTEGLIDDVRVYSYARTQQQIIQDMNAGHPAPGSPVGSAIGHWSFDEGYGTTTYDSGTGGNNGTLINTATWSNDGKFGKAVYFDGDTTGDDTHVRLVKDAYNSYSEGSISLWFKPDNSGENFQGLFSARDDFVGWGQMLEILFDNANDEVDVWTFGCPTNIDYGVTLENPNSWHHLVWKVDSSGNKLYIDGVERQSNSSTCFFDDLDDGTNGLHYTVGCVKGSGATTSCGGNEMFEGYIDDVRLFNSALTADQVKLLYNQGKSAVFGATSTDSSGNASWSAINEYCPPGQTTACVGPVAEWKMDKGSGQYAYDTSENSNTGTLGASASSASDDPQWIPSSRDSSWALEFDGSNDQITVTDSTSLQITGDITITAWIYRKDSNNANIISRKTYNTSGYGFAIWNNSLNPMIYAGSQYDEVGTDDVGLNEWHHVAFVKSGTTIIGYIDGLSESFSNTSSSTITPGSNTLYLANDGADNDVLNGFIDQLRIYNYARTPAQIAWSYNQGGPVGHWRLDECSGGNAYDSSGNGNNGTITIGGTGSQDDTGTCTSGDSGDAWYNGASGKFNSSLNFDGDDDYVTLGDLDYLDGVSQFSVSFWSYLDTISSWETFFRKSADDTNEIAIYLGGGGVGGNDDIVFEVSNSGSGTYGYTTNNSISTGVWIHVVGVYDGDQAGNSDRVKLYLNSIKQDLVINGTLPSTTDDNSSSVIMASNLGSYYIDGRLDEMKIFNYALTDEQVKLLYNNSSAVRFGP
ncbi:LamG-like jellyroll fold domain-containing protein [Patescibacteria group bacterium]